MMNLKYYLNMFVGSTFMSGIDRLSVRSVMKGSTSSILGVIGSATFIILCFIFFIGPVMIYFQGDSITSSFSTLKDETISQYSSCDFKMAISFHSKATKKPIDHTALQDKLVTDVFYASPTGSQYTTPAEICNPNYFQGMENKPHSFKAKECYIVPEKLEYLSEVSSGYVSTFGFHISTLCQNPFLCTLGSSANSERVAEIMNFFSEHYYVLYFTSNEIDEMGKVVKRWNTIYSTEWEGRETIIPYIYALSETQIVYLDDSIMPWFNNETIKHTVWYGKMGGATLSGDQIQFSGIRALLGTVSIQSITFKHFKKLDWLLGMLGGGFFLLYILFELVFSYINSTKQQIETCKALILTYEVGPPIIEDLQLPNIRILYYLLNWVPISLPCFKKERKLIAQSESMMDIVDVVKKLKVAMRNLRHTNSLYKFEQKRLVDHQIEIQATQETSESYNRKFEMPESVISKIQEEENVPKICETNYSMLMLNDSEQAREKMEKIEKGEYLSKAKSNKFAERKSRCDKILNFISKIFIFFDIFGAKPNLEGKPKNYSFWGCLITVVIIILAVLTFALTLGNMSTTRTYMDKIYVDPENLNVNLRITDNFKFAFCFNQYAFDQNLIVSEDRVADIKFYQYTREGTKETRKYQPAFWIKNDPTIYFDFNSESYSYDVMAYCFRPFAMTEFNVSGSDQTEKQEYFGVEIVPYCSGTAATCASKSEETKKAFYDLINKIPMVILMPTNNYFPEEDKIYSNPTPVGASYGTYIYDLNYSKSIEETILMDVLQIIDDRESWIIGESPAPKEKTLSVDKQQIFVSSESIPSANPYYNLKIKSTGEVNEVIFTNYKIDYLFAIIGGCFAFFFIIFGCLGKWYNQYMIKAKLAETLYNEDTESISCCAVIAEILGLPFGRSKVFKKIQSDMDAVNIVQRVDNCYHLSTVNYPSLEEKNLSLVFMKQIIKENDQVIIKQEEEDSDEEDELEEEDDFDVAWDQYILKKKKGKGVMNASDAMLEQDSMQEKILENLDAQMEKQPLIELHEPNRSEGKIHKFTKAFDLFKSPANFTLEGRKNVRSVCGGICCIFLLIFLILLLQHFLTIYFSNQHFVSNEKYLINDNEQNSIDLKVGENFKLMLSFMKADDFSFLDVSNLTNDILVQVEKYHIEKNEDTEVITKNTIPLISCPSNYIDGFTSEYEDQDYYSDLRNVLCVPDGTDLTIKGNPNSAVREYFKVVIGNKYPNDAVRGLEKVKHLLQNYLPRYHISAPLMDYNSGEIKYEMETVVKSFVYQLTTSREYNVTLERTQILYDTAVNPENQLPTRYSYTIMDPSVQQFLDTFIDSSDRSCKFAFTSENVVNKHIVKKIKVDELFGMVGGCIVLLFLGLGYFPRSFNEYRMKYLIGVNFYIILGQNKKKAIKHRKGKSKTVEEGDTDQTTHLSEFKIFSAWLRSFKAFFTENYNANKTLKYVSLIESKIGEDINVFEFFKNLQSCQISISRMNLTKDPTLDLTKVYVKKVEPYKSENIKIKDIHEELKEASYINKFSSWELHSIIEARKAYDNQREFALMFEQKWLDRFFGIKGRTVSRPSSTKYKKRGTSSSFNSENFSMMEKKKKLMKENLMAEDSRSNLQSDSQEDDPSKFGVE